MSLTFQEWKLPHRPVLLKNFGKAAKCGLWGFSKFQGVEQVEHISYANRPPQALQWKLNSLDPTGKYWREMCLMLGKQLTKVEMTHAGRLWFSPSIFWLICQNNSLGTTWKWQNVFATERQSCFLTSVLMELFKCTWPAPGHPATWYIKAY